MARTWLAAAGTILLIPALGACGGTSKASAPSVSGTATQETQAQYVRKADTICRSATSAVQAIRRMSPKTASDLQAGRMTPADFADLARFTGELMRAAGDLPARIQALPMPPGNRHLQDWLAAAKRASGAVVAIHRAALKKSRSALVAAANENGAATSAYISMSKRLGFRVCGQGSG
jgi:hypothetical protein